MDFRRDQPDPKAVFAESVRQATRNTPLFVVIVRAIMATLGVPMSPSGSFTFWIHTDQYGQDKKKTFTVPMVFVPTHTVGNTVHGVICTVVHAPNTPTWAFNIFPGGKFSMVYAPGNMGAEPAGWSRERPVVAIHTSWAFAPNCEQVDVTYLPIPESPGDFYQPTTNRVLRQARVVEHENFRQLYSLVCDPVNWGGNHFFLFFVNGGRIVAVWPSVGWTWTWNGNRQFWTPLPTFTVQPWAGGIVEGPDGTPQFGWNRHPGPVYNALTQGTHMFRLSGAVKPGTFHELPDAGHVRQLYDPNGHCQEVARIESQELSLRQIPVNNPRELFQTARRLEALATFRSSGHQLNDEARLRVDREIAACERRLPPLIAVIQVLRSLEQRHSDPSNFGNPVLGEETRLIRFLMEWMSSPRLRSRF